MTSVQDAAGDGVSPAAPEPHGEINLVEIIIEDLGRWVLLNPLDVARPGAGPEFEVLLVDPAGLFHRRSTVLVPFCVPKMTDNPIDALKADARGSLIVGFDEGEGLSFGEGWAGWGVLGHLGPQSK